MLDHEVRVSARRIELLRERDVLIIDIGHRRGRGRVAADRIPECKIDPRHDPPQKHVLIGAAGLANGSTCSIAVGADRDVGGQVDNPLSVGQLSHCGSCHASPPSASCSVVVRPSMSSCGMELDIPCTTRVITSFAFEFDEQEDDERENKLIKA